MTTALYRRYRPETFAEVIGQEHVTGPLMQALRTGRVNHAYLFSGPRGCGKTTSARILARTLNCHANTPATPIDTPCGTCPSCVDLARGGPGSLDVVEIDAASHGGVDDARDLRERATFAPARDRFKIFIIDEAHMVSSAGFNALLKIVEEPPPHIKFVFATTEPDKVIGTIRSRTHHYPFRLVPPDVLGPYLEQLCGSEGVTLGGGVVPLVVRAGGGSVRDSLSVMDQLIAGATGGGVDYDLAVGLLGYTHGSLLDDVVDALAARDGASLFRVVDQLIASGHAPQRFVDDLLERLRDLIVIAVSGDAAGAVLRDRPTDQLERMQAQAARLGVAELSRAADLVNAALTEMTGATSPRLHLELLCARLLLPGADEGAAGLAARVERLERCGLAAAGAAAVGSGGAPGASVGAGGSAAPGVAAGGLSGAAAARAALQASRRPSETPVPVPAPAPAPEAAPVPAPGPARESAPSPAPAPADEPVVEASDDDVPAPEVVPVEPPEAAAEEAPQDAAQVSAEASAEVSAEVTTEVLRRRWDEVLGGIQNPRAMAFLREYSQVLALDGDVLRLGFPSSVVAAARQGRPETISDAVYGTVGLAVRIEIVDVEADAAARPRDPAPARATDEPAEQDEPAPAGPASRPAADDTVGAAPVVAPARTAPVVDTARAAPTVDPARTAPAVAPARTAPPVDHAAAAPAAEGFGAAPAVDDADAAWLAGVPIEPPFAEDEPEPPVEDPGPSDDPPRSAGPWAEDRPPAPIATVTAPAPAPAPAAQPTPPSPGLPGRPAESPAEAAQRRALQARAASSAPAVPAASSAPDPYDDSSADDPDIVSSGLVGVPLVIKTLNGTIIDEQVDQG